MVQNNLTIDIPSNELWVVQNLIDRFIKLYKIKILITSEEDRGGINFISITSEEFTTNLIFEIGYYYSSYIRQLREEKKIDW